MSDDLSFRRPIFWRMSYQNFGHWVTNFLANQRPIFWRISDQNFGPNEWPMLPAIELPIFWRTNDQFFGNLWVGPIFWRMSYQNFGEPTTNFLVRMICRSDDQFFGHWVTNFLVIELSWPIFWSEWLPDYQNFSPLHPNLKECVFSQNFWTPLIINLPNHRLHPNLKVHHPRPNVFSS